MYKVILKINKVLLKTVFLISLWTCPHPVFADIEWSQGATPETIKLQTDGIVVQIPLDLSVIGKVALFQVAASFAAMLPVTMHYFECHRLAQASHLMGQRLASLSPYLNGVYYYSFLHPWIADTLFPRMGMTEVVPPASVSSITSPADPQHLPCSQIYLSPAFGVEKNLSGGLSALLGYLAEFSGRNITLNQPQFSFDKVASFSVLQNDGDHVRLSASILDGKNTTHNFWLGRHKEIFWIERLNQQDMTPAMRVAWSVSPSHRQTAKLSVQLSAPVELSHSGIPLEINIPAWLPRHLLSSGAKESLSVFSKQVLNWQLPHRLSRIFLRNQKAGGRVLESKLFEKNSDYSSGKETVLQPVTALTHYHTKSVPTDAGGQENNQASNPPPPLLQGPVQAGKRKRGRRKDEQGKEGDNVGNGDEGGKTPSSPLPVATHSLQEEKSLLWQATETFYTHSHSVMELEDAYRLIADLSSVGMTQVLPVDQVPMDQWPLVMSQIFADFLKQQLKIDASIVGEPDRHSEYVMRISQESFNQIIQQHETIAKLIDTRKALYSVIEQALTDYCGDSRYCYFGGEQVRRFIKGNNFGNNKLFEANLPVSGDADVMVAFTEPEAIIKAVNQVLTDRGLTDFTVEADVRSHEMSYTFSHLGKKVHFNLYKLQFKGGNLSSKYLPGLDFGIADKAGEDIAGQFLSPETIIYDSIKRGCGPTTDCRSKHLDRLRLLNTLFPLVLTFNDLRQLVIAEKRSVNVQTSISHNDLNQLESGLAEKNLKIERLKSKAAKEISKAKTMMAQLKANLAEATGEKQTLQRELGTSRQLNKKLESLQEAFRLQREELLESKNVNNEQAIQLKKERNDKISQLRSERDSIEKSLKSEINAIQQLLDGEMSENTREKNRLTNTLKDREKRLAEKKRALADKNLQLQVLEINYENLQIENVLLLWHNKRLKFGLIFMVSLSVWTVVSDILKFYRKKSPATCAELSYNYSRKVCLIIEEMDPTTFNIIKTMDQLSGHHRVVKYNLFLANLVAGAGRPVAHEMALDDLRKHAEENSLHLLLHYDSHTYWEEMNTDELAQIVIALSQGLADSARKPIRNLKDYIEGIIAYCGYMPNERFQRECTDRTIDRIFTYGYLPAELNIVKIDEPELEPGQRYVAFLPVWNISDKRMSWHDVWPYRLDSSGYHLLGDSSERVTYNYKCDINQNDIQISYFSQLRWTSISKARCGEGGSVEFGNVAANGVFRVSHYDEYERSYSHQAGSHDSQGEYFNF